MKHIFAIAMKDIQQSLRDKQTFLFLLGMPIIFTFLFGFAFGGLGGGSAAADERVTVTFVDEDHSAASQGLRGLLESQPALRVEAAGAAAENEQPALVSVPAGYEESLKAGSPIPVDVLVNMESVEGYTAYSAIQSAVTRASRAGTAARIASAGQPKMFTEAFEVAVAAWSNSPARLRVEGKPEQPKSSTILPLTHTAPAMMIQFALAGLLTSAQVLVHERKTRCMQRLLTTRAARHEILMGHFLAIFAVIFTQFVLLVGFGQLLLGLDYLRLPLGTLVMMLVTALFVAALGLLIGSLARSDEQAVIFAMAPMFVLSGLGGAWMPLEAVGESFRAVGQYTPVALALEGFESMIARGLDFNAVLLPAAALLGYAVLCFGLAVWKFKFE